MSHSGITNRITLEELELPRKSSEHAEPHTDYIEVQLMPHLPSKFKAKTCVSIDEGKEFRLDYDIDEVALYFDWKLKNVQTVVDVDAAAALFDKSLTPKGFVWWDKLVTPCESVRFISQDEKTGATKGTKEEIKVKLHSIPEEVAYVVLTASVYSKDYSMENLTELSLTIRDIANEYDMVQYKVVENLKGRSILIGCLVRKGEFWILNTMKGAMLSRTISEIMHEPENLHDVSLIPPTPRIRKKVVFKPIEGRNLTPMDFSLFTKRADPYLKIFYDDQLVMSEVCKANLNPTFTCDTIDFGEVAETCTKVVEIQVWDYDQFTQDDNMGVAKFCIGGLVANLYPGDNKVWFKLFPLEEHIHSNKTITGQIGVVLTVEEFT